MKQAVRAKRYVRVLCVTAYALCVTSRGLADPPPFVEGRALTGHGAWIDSDNDHIAISHDLPRVWVKGQNAASDPEAVRLVFVGLGNSPEGLRIETHGAGGALLDWLDSPKLFMWPCPPASPSGPCWITLPLRLAMDRLDRDYPAARERSLQAELGGELSAETAGRIVGRWRVGGPRSPAFAPFERLSAKLRVHILRVSPGGAPAIGGDRQSALGIARAEVRAASKLWAQCGIDLEGPTGPEIEVVDPPPSGLLAVGCNGGLPASGGQITFEVSGRRLRIVSRRGEAPLVVAQRISRALSTLGLRSELSPNQRATSEASGTIDVMVRNSHGSAVAVSPAGSLTLSTDATLDVCLGEVDLGNGLSHFVESDASAGTLEERALLKAFDDGDPSTIDIFIVPSFDQSGRIGESFIDDDGSAIQNTVIIDRAAVRAGPRSYALAHEIGHILLDMPGHPDDYGVDQSSSLMDADAADASIFGPHRLSDTDCARALRESGPTARIPLLRSWPIPHKSATSAR